MLNVLAEEQKQHEMPIPCLFRRQQIQGVNTAVPNAQELHIHSPIINTEALQFARKQSVYLS